VIHSSGFPVTPERNISLPRAKAAAAERVVAKNPLPRLTVETLRRPCARSRPRSGSSRPTTAPPGRSRFDLDDVVDEYLPAKLKHPEKFLP